MSTRRGDACGKSTADRWTGACRGQANLVAVAVALVLLTSVLGASLAVAESVLLGATEARDSADTHAASTLATRVVTDAPASYPPNVVSNRSLTVASVESLAPVVENASFEVALDGRTLAERGDPSGGATVHRAVLIGTPRERTAAIDLAESDTLVLPHRTDAATLVLSPGTNTTIQTVRVNDRVVLYNGSGLSGETTVRTSTSRETELTVETTSSAFSGARGSVEVSYTTVAVESATLTVTVDV